MGSDATEKPALIPLPAEMTVEAGRFTLTPETAVLYSGAAAKPVAELAAGQLGVFCRANNPGSNAIVFELSDDEVLHGEGYTLRVTGKQVTVKAQTAAGLFYGAQTLRQLVSPDGGGIPCVSIRDFPRFGWRGMHLDVSRHFMPKQDVLRFIDTIASLKFNRFHWHLTDDQGWRIEIKKYPKLTGTGAWRKESLAGHERERPRVYDGMPHGGFYTQDEIREVVRYAAERFVTVVPEIDMPGHMQAAVAAYPELGSAPEPAEVRREWGISPVILNPEESTVQFCKDVLSEVLALFPGELIHIGGDEAEKGAWENSPRIQQLRRERGLKDMDEMQSWFIRQIGEFLTQRGRRMIGWDEILDGGLAGDAVVMAWRGEEKGIVTARAGHSVVMAPYEYLYFDFYQAQPESGEPPAIGGFTPLKKVYEYDPVPAALTAQEREKILGAQGQLWTEYMPDMRHVEYMAFPRACALAEVLWSPAGLKQYRDFTQRLPAQLRRFEKDGINYRRPGKGDDYAG